MRFDIHHFAYLTKNIEFTVNEMSAIGFTLESPIYDIISQKVRVCFLRNKENIFGYTPSDYCKISNKYYYFIDK